MWPFKTHSLAFNLPKNVSVGLITLSGVTFKATNIFDPLKYNLPVFGVWLLTPFVLQNSVLFIFLPHCAVQEIHCGFKRGIHLFSLCGPAICRKYILLQMFSIYTAGNLLCMQLGRAIMMNLERSADY